MNGFFSKFSNLPLIMKCLIHVYIGNDTDWGGYKILEENILAKYIISSFEV